MGLLVSRVPPRRAKQRPLFFTKPRIQRQFALTDYHVLEASVLFFGHALGYLRLTSLNVCDGRSANRLQPLLRAAAERNKLPASPEVITTGDRSEPEQRSRLGRLDALVAEVAQVPGPDEAFGEDDYCSGHYGEANERNGMTQMISRTK